MTQDTSTDRNVKKSKVDTALDVTCDFEYLEERFTLSFSSKQMLFMPRAIEVKFRKQTIFKHDFSSAYERAFKVNEVFSVTVPFRKIAIDFFGFSKERIFTIVFGFEPVFLLKGVTLETKYSIVLPVLKQAEFFFRSPSMNMPDAAIRRICDQEFQMGPQDAPSAIKLVIVLEEFKLIAPVDRYKIYGYVEMLNVFIDIENSFELNLLKKSQINCTRVVKENAINYRIHVSLSDYLGHREASGLEDFNLACKPSHNENVLFQTPRQIPSVASSVCLTPIQFVNSSLDPKHLKKVQIVAPIVTYHAKSFVFEVKRGRKDVDVEQLYQV